PDPRHSASSAPDRTPTLHFVYKLRDWCRSDVTAQPAGPESFRKRWPVLLLEQSGLHLVRVRPELAERQRRGALDELRPWYGELGSRQGDGLVVGQLPQHQLGDDAHVRDRVLPTFPPVQAGQVVLVHELRPSHLQVDVVLDTGVDVS